MLGGGLLGFDLLASWRALRVGTGLAGRAAVARDLVVQANKELAANDEIGTLKSTTSPRSCVMVVLAAIKSTVSFMSIGIRLALVTGRRSNFTPNRLAMYSTMSISKPTVFPPSSMVPKGG